MLNYAIIGCGAAAKVHVHHLKEHKDVKIVATCDPIIPQDPVFTQLNVPHYQDYQEMLSKEKIDAVTIASPHHLHYEQILACAQKGIHILCEKPLAINYADAVTIVSTCKKTRVKLAVMLQRRLFNNSIALKRIIEDKNIGKINNITYELKVNKTKEYYQGWRAKKECAGGGVLLCQGLHDLDRIINCFGQPKIISSTIKTTREYIDIEDEAQVQLEFPGNITCQITATANAPTLWSGKIKVQGNKGSVVFDSEKIVEWKVPEMTKPQVNEKKNRECVPSYYDPCHEEIIEDFIQSIINNKEPIVSGESTLPALKVLFDIYDKAGKSFKTN